MSSIPNRGEDPRSPVRRKVRRRTTALLAALGAAVLLVSGPLQPAGAAEATDGPTAAAWASDWVDAELAAGLPLAPFGTPDWGTTLEAGLALAALDGTEARTSAVWDAVVAAREDVVTADGADVPGRLAQTILLAVALGEDPSAVGAGPGADLVARLQATRTAGPADEGLFGDQPAAYDGAYRQGYAIAALVAAGQTPDPTAVAWLLDQQCDDGSWMPYRADTAQPCAFDAAAFLGPDSNSTAAALSALAALGRSGDPAVAEALAWLDVNQQDDGGWGFFPGDVSDPNSTAVVIMALRSLGQLDAPAFTDRAGAPLQALLGFQLACAEGADAGSFTYPGSNGAPNTFATVQAVSAASGATLGITGPTATGPVDEVCVTPTAPPTAPPSSPPGADGAGPSDDPRVPADGGVRPAELAFTGATDGGTAAFGAGLLLLGAACLYAARVRRRT